MLDPVLDALAYLHSRGLVHGHVKPSNILAISEQLKLSSDWLQPAGEAGLPSIDHSIYDAPESTAGFISPAADVWSLGITLVEALTQRPLVPKRPPHKPPALPVTLPPLFLDIAHHCLQPDPQQRETVAQLADHLRHAPLTPQSPAPPARFRPGRWRYVVPVLALAATFSGMLVRPFHRAAIPAPAPPPPPRPLPPAAPPPPVARHIIEPPVPAVSESSLDTIQGTIEVRVRVRVDASGSVVNAALDSPGPSRYFADRSLDAARYCKFDPLLPPNGQAPEDWVLRFDYTADGAQVTGERVNASKAAL
jgi:TonB family protein